MNNFSFFRKYAVLLLTACALLPSTARAEYKVTVAGVNVDGSVEDGFRVEAPAGSDAVIEGVTYYPSSNTLVLDNATIIARGMGVAAIDAFAAGSGKPELSIKLIGESNVTSDYVTIYGQNSLTFLNGHANQNQRPILHITSTDALEPNYSFSGIELQKQPYWPINCQVTIDACDLDIMAQSYAVKGWYNYGPSSQGDPHYVDVNVRNSGTLRARTNNVDLTASVFQYVKGLNYGGEMQMPRKCTYDPEQMVFFNGAHQMAFPKELRIAPTIYFDDMQVKNTCVLNWDQNGDDRLDYIEARLVTTLSQQFQYKSYISSFNELRFFTGLHDLEDEAFYQCTGLEQVEMPYNLKSIGTECFYECSSLSIVTIPRCVEAINQFAFYFCTGLTNVVYEQDCQLKNIGWLAFGSCPIDYMKLPERLEVVGEQAFWDNRLTVLEIPASVTEIQDQAFCQINHTPARYQKIVFKRYTPPTVGADAFGATTPNTMGRLLDNTQILVPEYRLNAYKTAIPQYAPYMSVRNGYGIYICGQELAEDNLGEDGAFSYMNGNDRVYGVYYDPQAYTLTIADGQIVSNSTTRPAISFNSSTTLNIKLEGQSSIYTKYKGIVVNGMLNFTSTSTYPDVDKAGLYINSRKAGIEYDNSQFGNWATIELHNVAVGIDSDEGPCIDGGPYRDTDPESDFYIQVGDPASVILEDAVLNASSPYRDIIENVPAVDMTRCRIMQPTEDIYYSYEEPNSNRLVWTPLSLNGNLYIANWLTFQDPLVKEICVANFDDNGDGGIDPLEASNVTSLGTVFKGTDIETFYELEHFVGLETIDDEAFKDCRQLEGISYPRTTNLWRIGDSAFENCYSTMDPAHNIPSTVTEIGDRAFLGSMMEMVGIPASVVTIGDDAFSGCMGVYFADNAQLETIGDRAFSDMSDYSDVYIPASVVTIGEEAFVNCGFVHFAEDARLETIGERAFFDLPEPPSMIPASVKTIGREAFDTGSDENFFIWMEVKGYNPANIGPCAFGPGDLVLGDSKIFVPAGTASIYKQAWPEYARFIVSQDGPTNITGTVAEGKRQHGVFTLDGRQLRSNADTSGLPAGLYIVNGRKVAVK